MQKQMKEQDKKENNNYIKWSAVGGVSYENLIKEVSQKLANSGPLPKELEDVLKIVHDLRIDVYELSKKEMAVTCSDGAKKRRLYSESAVGIKSEEGGVRLSREIKSILLEDNEGNYVMLHLPANRKIASDKEGNINRTIIELLFPEEVNERTLSIKTFEMKHVKKDEKKIRYISDHRVGREDFEKSPFNIFTYTDIAIKEGKKIYHFIDKTIFNDIKSNSKVDDSARQLVTIDPGHRGYSILFDIHQAVGALTGFAMIHKDKIMINKSVRFSTQIKRSGLSV